MVSYYSIIKQICINHLNLSNDLLNEIKDYCFYDIKSWEIIQFIRYKKQMIDYIFTNHTISRANPYDFYDNNNEEHWCFWVNTLNDTHKCQFQGTNCIFCGNYKYLYNGIYIDRIRCLCNDDDDDDDTWLGDDDDSFGE
jgi:hypothetical protein